MESYVVRSRDIHKIKNTLENSVFSSQSTQFPVFF
jgi:hypothetical protein